MATFDSILNADLSATPKRKVKITKRTKQEVFEQTIKNLQKQRLTSIEYNKQVKSIENPTTGEILKAGKRNINKINKDINKFNKQNEKQIFKELKQKLDIAQPGTFLTIPLSRTNNLEDIYTIIQAFTKYISSTQQIVIGLYVGGDTPLIYYTFNTRNRDRLRDIIKAHLTTGEITGSGSDAELITYTQTATSIQIRFETVGRKLKNGKAKTKPRGGFFPYYHNTKFDFTEYQIFKNEEQADYDDNCLVYALKMGGLDEIKINHFRLMCRNREIPLCKIEDLCIKSNIQINLKYDADKTVKIYGDSQEQYNIGVLEHHFFINEDVNISTYCIKNYEDVKDIKDCNFITEKNGKYYKKNLNYKISSFILIKTIIDNGVKLLTQITHSNGLLSTQYHNKNDTITLLEYPDECARKILNDSEKPASTFKKVDYTDKIYFDIETDPTGNTHIPFLVRSKQLVNGLVIKKRFIGYGDKCILDFLKSIKNNSVLIAHNAGGYDSVFLVKFLYEYKEICRGNSVLGCTGTFKNFYLNKDIKFKIKDSLKLINMRLDEFPECFFPEDAKTFAKEVMPYNLYTKTNIENVFCKIDDGIKILKLAGKKDSDIKQFLDNIEKWNVKKDDTFDIVTYADIYCERDVDILERGYEIFRTWMLELTNYDIDGIISLASLSDKHLINKDCYKDCYELSGVPQSFIMKCVVGGRCMTRQNKRFKCKQVMQALDAKSLYPSAMNRMSFLKGKPKVIKQDELNYQQLKDYDGFFVECVATSINIKRDFPLLSYIDSNGNRLFTNDIVGRTFYLDKTMFEDVMIFQGVNFEIKRGYYFNDGVNDTIQNVIYDMYTARAQKREEGNPIQLAYKELLNCAYGKTILKPTEYEFKFIDGEDKFNNFLKLNYNFIQEYMNITPTKYRVKVIKAIDDHFNRPHIGVSILSMSKRIMNEVMCLSEDNNVLIAYQDTDSMSMINSQLPTISKLYFEKYGRILIGDNMGQFGNDLKFKYVDEHGNKQTAKNVVSVESQYLGKKCYHHKLVGEDKQKNNVYGDYIRMKGVSGDSITHLCDTKKIEVNELYKDLLVGNTATFDLLCKDENGNALKVSFIKNKDKTIGNKKSFERDVNFKRVSLQEFQDF